nr:hypothetical protein [Tanacetum cinerariifolium]
MTPEAVRAMIDQAMQRNSTNGDGSHSSGRGPTRPVQSVRACSYSDFMKCQPLNFRGTEDVAGLTLGHDVAYAMTWETLKKKMTDKYCPRGEIKKLETELNTALMRKRQTESKRKFDNNNQAQQIPKRKNVAQAYIIGTGERKEYAGTLPLCNKCKFHHNGPCTTKYTNCKKVGHLTKDCWNPTTTSSQKTITCYECWNQGHYKSDCPELKNQKHGNQAEGTEARGMVYALGGEETNQYLDNIEDDINA